MAEHHIHVHVHSDDKNTQALTGLATLHAAEQAEVQNTTVQSSPDYTRLRMVAIMTAAFIGREKGELSKETSARLAGEIADLILERLASTRELAVEAAHVAAGYISHGQGHYKKTTIADRAVETVESITF